MKKFILVALFIFIVFIAAACSDKGLEQFNDAPRGENNDSIANTISFPDGFSNVATKCDGPNQVYVLFKGDNNYGSVSVVANSANCNAGGVMSGSG